MDKKVVLITGAARGIGRETALFFGRNGCNIIINYIKEKEKAESAAEEIIKCGGNASIFKCDISIHAQADNMVDSIVRKHKRIDILINNAGICGGPSIIKTSGNIWNKVINVDLNGPFYVLRKCAQFMAKQSSGSIINIASVAGVRGSYGGADYSSAKAGLIALTKSAAKELGRFNVCVNAVLPGFHLTDMGRDSSDRYKDTVKQESVLNTTTDLYELVQFLFFLSNMKTVSGQVFNWDSRII